MMRNHHLCEIEIGVIEADRIFSGVDGGVGNILHV